MSVLGPELVRDVVSFGVARPAKDGAATGMPAPLN